MLLNQFYLYILITYSRPHPKELLESYCLPAMTFKCLKKCSSLHTLQVFCSTDFIQDITFHGMNYLFEHIFQLTKHSNQNVWRLELSELWECLSVWEENRFRKMPAEYQKCRALCRQNPCTNWTIQIHFLVLSKPLTTSAEWQETFTCSMSSHSLAKSITNKVNPGIASCN